MALELRGMTKIELNMYFKLFEVLIKIKIRLLAKTLALCKQVSTPTLL